MAQTTKFGLLNNAARGKLHAQIHHRRERNESYADIAWWIEQRYGIRVTGEAVRQWYQAGQQ